MEVISDNRKVRGYMVNIQKSIIDNTGNEQVETEIKNTMPFTSAPTKMKHWGIYLTCIISIRRKLQNSGEWNQKITK